MYRKLSGALKLILSSLLFLAFIIAAALSFTGKWKFIGFAQKAKPKCTCWFPQDKTYGVLDEKEGCKVIDCDPPPKPPKP